MNFIETCSSYSKRLTSYVVRMILNGDIGDTLHPSDTSLITWCTRR